MPVPETIAIQKPLLEIYADNESHSLITQDLIELLAKNFDLDVNKLSSREKALFRNHINTARKNLIKYRMIEKSFPENENDYEHKITEKGLRAIENNPEIIDQKISMSLDSIDNRDPQDLLSVFYDNNDLDNSKNFSGNAALSFKLEFTKCTTPNKSPIAAAVFKSSFIASVNFAFKSVNSFSKI